MNDLYYYFREQNELVFIRESYDENAEENTVEFLVFPVTRIGDMDVMTSEHIFADMDNPRDGGWFTFEDSLDVLDELDVVQTIIAFEYDIPSGETIVVYRIDDYDIRSK